MQHTTSTWFIKDLNSHVRELSSGPIDYLESINLHLGDQCKSRIYVACFTLLLAMAMAMEEAQCDRIILPPHMWNVEHFWNKEVVPNSTPFHFSDCQQTIAPLSSERDTLASNSCTYAYTLKNTPLFYSIGETCLSC